MKNKIIYITYIILINFFFISASYTDENFNFDVTEAEIIENGKKFLGKNGGIATSKDGTTIKADNFEYDKITNILIANGNVIVDDKKNDLKIYSKNITYFKNKEFIISEGQSKAINKEMVLEADNFEYDKITNILIANGNVIADDKKNDLKIYSKNITYFKNKEFIISEGQSKAINKEMVLEADNFEYDKITNILIANGNVIADDKKNDLLVYTDELTYYKNDNKIISAG